MTTKKAVKKTPLKTGGFLYINGDDNSNGQEFDTIEKTLQDATNEGAFGGCSITIVQKVAEYSEKTTYVKH